MKQGFVEHTGESESVEWYTPPEIFETLDLVFDLDPASPNNQPVYLPAINWYTKEDDGLKQDWYGKVWLNPPYTRNEMGLWLQKFIDNGNGVALLFARSDTKWFHEYIPQMDSVLFKKGRVKFLLDGVGKGSAQAPSILCAMGKECSDAIKKFDGMYFDIK